jgi:hypothetical protein
MRCVGGGDIALLFRQCQASVGGASREGGGEDGGW